MKSLKHITYHSLSIILLVLLRSSVGYSQSNTVSEIESLLSTYHDYGQFNGAALISKEGKVIYSSAKGKASMEWNIDNQSDTKFRLASVTKQFTAMLIMQLVEQGKLDLDEHISTYLEDYPKDVGDKVSIHHLLTHSSGIPNYTSFDTYYDMMAKSYNSQELVESFQDSTLLFGPGERFDYSNSGYVLLGVIIEKITNKTFDQVLQEQILTPLQMRNTGYENTRDIILNKATCYDKHGPVYAPARYIDMSVAFSAGGLYSTVDDLHIWSESLKTEKLLSKKYLDILFTPHISAWRNHYGYGWNISERYIGTEGKKIQTIDHDGVVNGSSSIILKVPSEDISIIILNNVGGAPMQRIAESILAVLQEVPFNQPKRSIADAMYEEILTEGIDSAMAFFQEHRDCNAYYTRERDLNMTGYVLLENDKLDEALAIFELNIKLYPRSANVYDSYAEALLKAGRKEEAIQHYKTSISLNPQNENAKDILHQMGIKTDDIKVVNYNLLNAIEGWGHEVFHFPLHFAKNIEFTGWEEAHFPPHWSKQDSSQFWSYVFAWNITNDIILSEEVLENNLAKYFDGLSAAVNKNKDKILPKAIIDLHRSKDASKISSYIGTAHIYDSFVTEDTLTLNVEIELKTCDEENRTISIFRFSPKENPHSIWHELYEVNLIEGVCED